MAKKRRDAPATVPWTGPLSVMTSVGASPPVPCPPPEPPEPWGDALDPPHAATSKRGANVMGWRMVPFLRDARRGAHAPPLAGGEATPHRRVAVGLVGRGTAPNEAGGVRGGEDPLRARAPAHHHGRPCSCSRASPP